MRDLDRVRDKIEIRLDPKQVFSLGVATLVFTGGLFAAGYWAGQRQGRQSVDTTPQLGAIDAAARAAREDARGSAPAPALGDVEFLFPSALAAGARGGLEQAAVRIPALIVDTVGLKPIAEPIAEPMPTSVAALPVAVSTLAPVVSMLAPALAPTAPPEVRAPAPENRSPIVEVPVVVATLAPPPPDEVEETVVAQTPRQPATQPSVVIGLPPPPDEDEPTTAEARKGSSSVTNHYTLQVKSIKDKGEADAFIAKLKADGFEASLIMADVPRKGRYYRIRVGRFESMEAARDFQRQFKSQSGLTNAGFVTDL